VSAPVVFAELRLFCGGKAYVNPRMVSAVLRARIAEQTSFVHLTGGKAIEVEGKPDDVLSTLFGALPIGDLL
jgi:hypothetical protein